MRNKPWLAIGQGDLGVSRPPQPPLDWGCQTLPLFLEGGDSISGLGLAQIQGFQVVLRVVKL